MKYCGGVKRKVYLFMEIFEVSEHPLWIVPALYGWWQTFLAQIQERATPPKQYAPPKKVGHHPERAGPSRREWLLTSKTSMII